MKTHHSFYPNKPSVTLSSLTASNASGMTVCRRLFCVLCCDLCTLPPCRICVLTLAETHPVLCDGRQIKSINYQISNGCSRLNNKVSGKSKRVSTASFFSQSFCVQLWFQHSGSVLPVKRANRLLDLLRCIIYCVCRIGNLSQCLATVATGWL